MRNLCSSQLSQCVWSFSILWGFCSVGSCPCHKPCFPEVEDACFHSWLPLQMECQCVTSLLLSDRAREPSIYKSNPQHAFCGRDSGLSAWGLRAALAETQVFRAGYHGGSFSLGLVVAPWYFSRTVHQCGLGLVPDLSLALFNPLENL